MVLMLVRRMVPTHLAVKEWQQMEAYIEDNLASPKFYLKSGVLEPVHLNLEERNILVSGLEDTMNRCVSEIEAAQQRYID